MNPTFVSELESLINRYSLESGSDTPDFLLAEYLSGCVDVWNRTCRGRDKWHGFKPFGNEPVGEEGT